MDESPSSRIDARIRVAGRLAGQEPLARVRALIKQADPGVTEEWKWNVPVWSHDGLICTGEAYKSAVKLTFAKGAQLEDPSRLFNSSLEGNTRRAIDLHDGDAIDEAAFKTLIPRRRGLEHVAEATGIARATARTDTLIGLVGADRRVSIGPKAVGALRPDFYRGAVEEARAAPRKRERRSGATSIDA
jgi:hypothetical protein